MKLPPFDYACPGTLPEAIALLAAGDGDAKVLAGGQSLMPMLAFRLAQPALLVDLRKLADLRAIRVSADGVTLGAMTRWRDIEDDERLDTAHPLLKAAIAHVAHYQIRNRGTVGGSIAHADPAAEMPGIAITCDAEVAEQSKQLAVMAKQKQDADKALALVGKTATGGGYVVATSPVARPAPRNSNGSWPSQGCTQNDPTTSGCLTPRMLHALQEAKRAGFNRFVSCYRPGGPYEHPKGRACDFSCRNGSFGGIATGNDRIYGNNLMAFFVRNASRLGVLYVIWYKMIWSPAAGWRTYSGANGDPSSNHTNHVHVSII